MIQPLINSPLLPTSHQYMLYPFKTHRCMYAFLSPFPPSVSCLSLLSPILSRYSVSPLPASIILTTTVLLWMIFIFHLDFFWQCPNWFPASSLTFSHPFSTERKCVKFKSGIFFCWNHFSGSPSSVKSKLSKLFWKGPDSKYFKLCRPDGLCHKSSLPL